MALINLIKVQVTPSKKRQVVVTKEANASHCCLKNEQRELKSVLHRGDTHEESPSITDKGMAPQT